jgi:nucleoside-diphosphate-sugar epimerase
MRILVTGGAGFIGSNLCRRLLEEGHTVIAVDNLITGAEKNILPLTSHPKFTFIKHDIVKPLATGHTPLAISQIYHLACPTGVPNLGPLAQEMLLTCSLGTRNVLELAKKNGAKVLFTSSSEVYGDPQVFPQSEGYTGNVDPTGPRSPYEEGKRFAESLITMYVKKYKIDAKIVRIFNTYGPGMLLEESRVIPRFLKQALADKPLTVQGKGLQKRTFCYIDDLFDGLTLIMEKGKIGEVYNLGSDTQTTIRDLAKIIIRVTDSKSKIKFVKRPTHDHQSRLPTLEKVEKLGWWPKISLEVGLKKTLPHYR